MRTSKQVVFIVQTVRTRAVIHEADKLELKVFDSRGDAMRFAGGDASRITPRSVVPDSERGPYRKPPKRKQSSRRNQT